MTQLLPILSAIEADLVSAHAHGPDHLHAEVFRKLSSLQLDADDRQAVLAMLDHEQRLTDAKLAGLVPLTNGNANANPSGGFGFASALALGTLLAAPAMAGVQFLRRQADHDNGWASLQANAPELIRQDPQRARAVYELLHSTAPTVAQNPVVSADLTRQMMAMPMVDIGTVSRLADTGKSIASAHGDHHGVLDGIGGVDNYPKRLQAMQALLGQKTAGAELRLPVAHVSSDGVPCVFNWASPAIKSAGLTDAFSGSGTGIEQANNGFGMQQLQQGQTLLPLDAVVRELLAKEMELQQREEMIAQQEQQLMQAQQMQQQLAGVYQQQTGVNPASGQALSTEAAPPQPGAEDPSMAQPPAEDPSMAQGQPPVEDPSMAQGQPPAEDPSMAQGQPPMEDPSMAPGQPPMEDPSMAPGQPPMEDPSQPPMGDPSMAQGQPGDGDPSLKDSNMAQAMDQAQPGMDDPSGATEPEGEGEDEELDGDDIEGSQQELADHHAGPGALPEGSPEDQAADAQVATQMNASGERPMPAGVAPALAAPAAPALSAPIPAQPDASGGFTFMVPMPSLQVSIKMAGVEEDPILVKRAAAFADAERTMASLFRP